MYLYFITFDHDTEQLMHLSSNKLDGNKKNGKTKFGVMLLSFISELSFFQLGFEMDGGGIVLPLLTIGIIIG